MSRAPQAVSPRDVIRGASVPVLVDFWATWCPPCRQLLPIVEELARESDGSYEVVKVDVDEHPDLASEYAVQSVPTLIVFRDGEVHERLVGLRPRAQILAAIDRARVD